MLSADQVRHFRESGYLFPLAALSETEAARCFARLRALGDGEGRLAPSERQNPHLYLAWVADLARDERILGPVADVLGPDLLLWRSAFFVKPPGDPAFAAWHQDAAYWGLEGDDVVTAWLALTDSTEESGCVRVVPGSHRQPLRPHVLARDPGNLLIRGQRIAGDVPESHGVSMCLAAGQFSLHSVGIIHGSPPNRSAGPRAGLALRYVAPRVRPVGGRQEASLVRGRDGRGHFDPVPLPVRDADPEAMRRHRRSQRGYARRVLGEIVRRPSPAALGLIGRLALRPGTWRTLLRLLR